MFKIAVCDDEVIQRLDVIKKVKSAFEKNYCYYSYDIEEFSSGENLISSGSYFDIVFLDIKLGKLSGIDLAKSIRENNMDTIIIFITAFEEYIFEAFDVSAFHYLMKPAAEEKILEIIHRILKARLIKENDKKYITINKAKSTIKVLLDNIHFFEVQNRVINIHTEREVIQYYDKIAHLEEMVSSDNFFRCHRSYIVNLKYVMKFNKTEIVLDNGTRIGLSKSKYDEFSKSFLKYIKQGGA